VASKGPERLAIEAAVRLQATHTIPAIIPNPFEERFRGIPGIEEDVFGAAAQAIPGIAQQFQGQCLLRGSATTPKANADRAT
jgi:hypothetical protein